LERKLLEWDSISGNDFCSGSSTTLDAGTYTAFQTPIVSLQSGNSLYLGKPSNYPKVSNNLIAPFYGTFAKSSQTDGL